MKSIYAIFFLILFNLFASHAQKVNVSYGPRVGFNFSTFVGKDAVGTGLRAGALLGVYGNVKFSKHFSVQSELIYLTAGDKYILNKNTANETDVKIDISYLTVPLVLDYVFLRSIHLQLGAQGGLSLTSETVTTHNNISVKDASKSYYRSFEIGIVGGVIYETPLGVNLGVRFFQSASNLYYGSDPQIYNTYFQGLIGYTFHKAKEEVKIAE